MTHKNTNLHRKAEEDAFRNSDSMMPEGNGHQSSVATGKEALPKTRRQRRLEQQSGIPASGDPKNPLQEKELRGKARLFSLMVFNDPGLDPATYSSLSLHADDIVIKKKWGRKKPEEPEEEIDMRALESHIDSLLGMLL